MPGRREVNVDRPEHSWIPFYRELAEKLADPGEGWRGKQRELMNLARELARNEDLGVPASVADCEDPYMDPFSLVACFSNSSKGEKRLLTIQRIREFFDLRAKVLHADYYVPEIPSVNILYWTGMSGYRRDADAHWDTFEFILNADPFDDATDNDELIRLMDASLNVKGVDLTKLSSAFYCVNPFNFLERKTINGILGREIIKVGDDASIYLENLILARQNDDRRFPEINDEVYLRDHLPERRPSVWMVRGGRDESAVDEFLSEDRVGIGFGLGGVDLSVRTNRREITDAYREANDDANNRSVGQNVGQINDFILGMKVGDYVIMPAGDQVRYGAITSRPYRDSGVQYENSRNVDWYEDAIPRERLSDLPRRKTVSEVKDRLNEEFLAWVRPSSRPEFKMPEDSWVPFHLAAGRKLVEGEWWLEEKRDEFARKIDEIRRTFSADVGESDGNKSWGPDPYSFYDSFSIRETEPESVDAYQRVKDSMDIEVPVPIDRHGPFGLRWGWDVPIGDEAESFLWDFFRFAVEFDPLAGDTSSEQRFIDFYDRASSQSFLPGKRGRVWSYFLYWIDPTKYLITRRLSKRELALANDLDVSETLSTGAEYIKALKGIQELGDKHRFTVLDVNRKSTTREMLGLDAIVDVDGVRYGIDEMLDDGVFLERGELERMKRILESKKNLILQGPPGVGKTFIARKLAYVLMERKDEKRVTSVQFHQSYSYEDFVGGFRPDVGEDGQMVFTRQDGPFLEMCATARANPGVDYVILIDEINRGNLSRVFGELLMLIEADKREPEYGVTLQHRPDAKGGFYVPENVYIIGTMNLADRSLTGMNVAMRRRFGFVDLKPQFDTPVFKNWLRRETDMPEDLQNRMNSKMRDLNKAIAKHPSLNENYAVGHSFFCPRVRKPAEGWDEWYQTIIDFEIRPLLRDYWFDDPDTAKDEADKLKDRD